MFWGLIMEPERCYTQTVKVSFHVSMAALDISNSSDDPTQVMCVFEGRNYLLCTLKKKDLIQCPLDLNFEAGTTVSFATNGKAHVHLTGYLINDDDVLEEKENEEEEEEQEARPIVKKEKKRLKELTPDGPPSKKSKTTKNNVSTNNEEEDSDDSDFDVDKLMAAGEEDDEEDSDVGEEEEEAEDEEEDDEEAEEEESSLSANEEEAGEEERSVKPKQNGVAGPQSKKNKEQKRPEKAPKPMRQENKKEQQQKQKPKPKKTVLKGGVVVEELKEGNGEPVKEGKFVHVYYEGRLKENNKMFDSTTKGPGFSFRIGKGEVIKGWDIGLVGMKVGGKRRITCPPKVAYGTQGSPPVIPPNATLVFDVELKKIS